MINPHKIPFKKRLALNLFSQYRKNTTKLHNLNYLFWESTLRCNFNCLHCGSDCRSNSEVADMPLIDFLKVIDEFTHMNNPNKTMIVITGGEPLLRNDLEKCGIELYKRGFPWGFVTNGYQLTEKRFKELLNSGLRAVTVSLDGLEKEHNWLRNKTDSYFKVIDAIGFISKESSIIFDVVTCVNQRNIDKLIETYHLLIDLNVKSWRLFTISPIGRAKDNSLLTLSNTQLKDLLDFIEKMRNEGTIDVSFGCEGFLGNYESKVRDEFFFCRAGINIASVLADGSISACPNINRTYIQGNIYEESFIDVWNNQFVEMRDRSWTKKGICETCNYFKWCNGSSMHLRDKKGELLFCHLNKIKDI